VKILHPAVRRGLALAVMSTGLSAVILPQPAHAQHVTDAPPDPFASARFSVAIGAGGVPLNVVEAVAAAEFLDQHDSQ
jgi:hypothetical protein